MPGFEVDQEPEEETMGSVLDSLAPAIHHLEEVLPVVSQRSRIEFNPDIEYLLSKREPVFPPYIRSLIHRWGESCVLEALRRLDGRDVGNAYLGGVVRHVGEEK